MTLEYAALIWHLATVVMHAQQALQAVRELKVLAWKGYIGSSVMTLMNVQMVAMEAVLLIQSALMLRGHVYVATVDRAMLGIRQWDVTTLQDIVQMVQGVTKMLTASEEEA